MIPAPAVAVLILAIHGLSFSGSIAKASENGTQGACSLTKLAILAVSEELEMMSAIAPSAPITVPLCTSLIALTPLCPIPAALPAAASLTPVLAAPVVQPPTPPVAYAKRPNSTKPRLSLPRPDLFSGTK